MKAASPHPPGDIYPGPASHHPRGVQSRGKKIPQPREDDEPGGIFLSTPNSALWARVTPAPGVQRAPRWCGGSARGSPSARIVPGMPELRPVGCWSFWDEAKGPGQLRGWMSAARGAKPPSCCWVGGAEGFPQRVGRFGFQTPLSRAGLAQPHGHTDTPAGARLFTRPPAAALGPWHR